MIIEPVSAELKAARIANTEKENKKKGILLPNTSN